MATCRAELLTTGNMLSSHALGKDETGLVFNGGCISVTFHPCGLSMVLNLQTGKRLCGLKTLINHREVSVQTATLVCSTIKRNKCLQERLISVIVRVRAVEPVCYCC